MSLDVIYNTPLEMTYGPTQSNHPLAGPPPKPFIRGIIEGFYGTPWTQMQRREMIRLLSQLGMNTYVYAPKDDVKHRLQWRDRYNTEEAGELQSLIEYSKSIGLDFIYALSPGIDIEYSNAKDITAVKGKLEQMKNIGCEGFALLFDDIEYHLSDDDTSQYGTPANAQVAVVNDCYTHLNSPTHFYFCPTEYCSTRGKPSLLESDYLRTIGDRLHPGIEIFWTGPLVIPKLISSDHSKAVAMVLKRKPLIWDNLYANDYDKRRLFLGPFQGRPQSLKSETSGILLNPNCQWELNYPAIHTYAEWFNFEQSPVPVTESSMDEDSNSSSSSSYVGETALKSVLQGWLKDINVLIPNMPAPRPRLPTVELSLGSSPPGRPDPCVTPITTISNITNAIKLTNDEGPSTSGSESGLVVNKEEPMDRSPSDESDVSMVDSGRSTSNFDSNHLTFDQLLTLSHCYYLPFDHGERVKDILKGYMYCFREASLMATFKQPDVPLNTEAIVDWLSYFSRVTEYIDHITCAFRFLHHNKALQIMGITVDLVKYASEAHGILAVMEGLLHWIRDGNYSYVTEVRDLRWENDMYGEPWAVFHGFVEDVAYAILPITASAALNRLLSHKSEETMLSALRIRQFKADDVSNYSSLRRTVSRDLNEDLLEMKNFFNRFYRPFLDFNPELCFVAEELTPRNGEVPTTTVCGILNILQFYESYHNSIGDTMIDESAISSAWMPPLPQQSDIQHYTSFIDLRARCDELDKDASKRLIQMIAVVLSYQGSTGLYTACSPCERDKVNLLLSLQFTELNSTHMDQILLGLLLTDIELNSSDEEEFNVDIDEETEPREKSVEETSKTSVE